MANRKQISKAVLLFFCMALLVSSCKKNIQGITPPNEYAGNTLEQVFEAYWTGMNNDYVFWSIDTTNWDRVYSQYQPLFAKLNINDTQDVLQAYQYFEQMTAGLVDCHYNLSFTNPILANLQIDPARERKTYIQPVLPFTYFNIDVKKNFLDKTNYYSCYSSFQTTFAGKPYTSYMGMVTGTINGDIVYLHLNQFAVADLIGQGYDSLTNAWNAFVSNMRNPTLSAKGIIIDMRSNSGGDLEDLNFMWGQMITSQLTFAYSREKSDNGRLDYTPWAPAIVTPATGATAFTGKIVVLTDQNTVSMAEMTTMALKCLPNTYVIGDTTWGANGPLSTDISLFGGGQFAFANFGYVYTSSAMYKYRNGDIYEDKGFPPDMYVPWDQSTTIASKDPQMIAAIDYLQ